MACMNYYPVMDNLGVLGSFFLINSVILGVLKGSQFMCSSDTETFFSSSSSSSSCSIWAS